jgi:hypothetical protein
MPSGKNTKPKSQKPNKGWGLNRFVFFILCFEFYGHQKNHHLSQKK